MGHRARVVDRPRPVLLEKTSHELRSLAVCESARRIKKRRVRSGATFPQGMR